MKQPAMVAQVDRIIRNTLMLRREICLPEVGSLYIARQGAVRHKHRLTPSCQRVCFTSRERGESLVAILAREIGGDTEQAAGIYRRWLGYARQEKTLTVGCCGVLHHKHFSMNGDFDALLNPFGRGPMELIPRRRPALWLATAAVVLLLAGAGYVGYMRFAPDAAAPAVRPALEPERPTAAAVESRTELQLPAEERVMTEPAPADSLPSASAAEPAAVQPQAKPQAADAASGLVSGRSYVVLGVFSTEANARRAAGEVSADAEMEARVYPYGAKWMVSIYESDNRDACLEIIRSQSAHRPDLWPYTAK